MNELTKEDYKSALKVWSKWNTNYTHFDTFKEYCDVKISRFEQFEKPMYKCIKLPKHNYGNFELDELYNIHCPCDNYSLCDLPNHFKLIIPEPKIEKITWEELLSWFETQEMFISNDLHALFNRIKIDHL